MFNIFFVITLTNLAYLIHPFENYVKREEFSGEIIDFSTKNKNKYIYYAIDDILYAFKSNPYEYLVFDLGA